MGQFRKGHEVVLYYGTAGARANASTLFDGAVNIDVKPAREKINRKNRGDGTKLPQADYGQVDEDVTVTMSITYKNGHAPTEAFLAAESTGLGKAIKVLPYVGATRIKFDGDCYIALTNDPGQIADGQVLEFELSPTSDYGGRAGGPVFLREVT